MHALEYRFGSRQPLGFTMKSEANIASVTGPVGEPLLEASPQACVVCERSHLCDRALPAAPAASSAEIDCMHALGSLQRVLCLRLMMLAHNGRLSECHTILHWPAGPGEGAAALTDPAAFDLAALDTVIWNDVLDAASMASDFAF